MDALSRIAASGNQSARAVYDSGFRFLARTSNHQIGKILSGTLVPTRDGTWRAANEVVAHGGAVAFAHRLDPELSRLLPQSAHGSSDDPRNLRPSDAPAELTEKQSVDSLRPILARAKVAVPAEMLAVLVFMLGRSDCWRALMREELGLATPVIEGIERDFENQVDTAYRKGSDQSLIARSARMRIQFRPRRDLQGEDEFVSIAGTTVMLPLGDAQPLEIVGTIRQNWKNEQTKDLHNLTRRRALDVVLPDDVRLTDRHVTEFCRTLAEEYVGSVRDQPEARAALDALLAGRARFAEHVASAVRAEIRDQMPKILGEMKPRPGGTLERARKDYEDAVRGAGDGVDAMRQELKDRLWTKVDQPKGHAELLERVRARITEDGYAPARIFFELFQNADDAWQQDPACSDAPGQFELSRDRGTTTMSHWGRLINVVGAGSHGERMGWHRDLYHMLLLNLSDKDRAEAVTGKFGLGFKAVHLLADQVRIASRHVACHIREGTYLDRRHDASLPDREPFPRPELRMVQRPIGPVAVFGASNFPLAFSVAGGDTASALAAGCPVVVKGHSAHPGTSEIVAQAIAAAVTACDMPLGVFSLIQGGRRDVGEALVQHPLINAVGFTGSLSGGRALFNLCAQRPVPIPFFGELGSINPVFILPNAASARGAEIGTAWAGSLTMGAGQFCTNPGVVFIEDSAADAFISAAAEALSATAEQIMLTDGMAEAYRQGAAQVQKIDNLREVVGTACSGRGTLPYLFETTLSTWIAETHLSEEVFGPLGIVVRVPSGDDFEPVARGFGGQLTATLQMDDADIALASTLLPILERKAGRILANGFPTGVEVSDTMVHGGPYPASTNFGATSVGTLSIRRWLRPVCYQSLPESVLPHDAIG